ncbi:MAG: STAS domain-containing protein [Betaproteobacteria bacterium]|nr:STAS domain-containing protein [Betaproteobacteria bacterium]
MIRDAGDRLEVTGPLTLGSAKQMLDAGSRQVESRKDVVFDLAQVQEIDSSGLTVIFGWVRAAQRAGKTVRIAHPPQNLLSLARLYGVTDLLPLA